MYDDGQVGCMEEMCVKSVCKKSTKTVNDNTTTEYRYRGRLYASVTSLLASIYPDQGAFYETAYGVSRDDARLAGWEPYTAFGRFNLKNNGFIQFLKDQGSVTTAFKTTEVAIGDLLNNIMDEYKPDEEGL